MANVTIYTIPIGSQHTESIETDDPEDKNDFTVLLVWDENVDGLTLSDCSIDNDATLQSIEGSNSVYFVIVRPTAGDDMPLSVNTSIELTFRVSADAVTQGNAETTKTIRLSRTFPDSDAETPVELAAISGNGAFQGIATTPTRILISNLNSIFFYIYDGTLQTGETLTGLSRSGLLDYINQDIILSSTTDTQRFSLSDGDSIVTFDVPAVTPFTHIDTGFLGLTQDDSGIFLQLMRYGVDYTDSNNIEELPCDFNPSSYDGIAHQNGLLYLIGAASNISLSVAEVVDDSEIKLLRTLNIEKDPFLDLAIYADTLYLLNTTQIKTLDIKPYRPMVKNTKTLIHPVIVTGATTIDLSQFAPDAKTIIFDVGFDLPSYLSIANNILTITGTFTEITTCFVRLKGINYVDATETGTFGFYLIIMPNTAPVWNSVDALTMNANSTYDLGQLVDADSITFRTGITQPTGSSISDDVFTIGTVGGEAQFTATKGSLTTHKTLQIDVIQIPDNIRGTRTRYKVEIEGIDISADLLNVPTVSENLDPIAINETRINEATIRLKNHNTYDINKIGNFWDANNLNSGGFQNTIKVYTEHLISGTWTENLIFSGVISESFITQDQRNVFFQMNCVDASRLLQNIEPQEFGRLNKWAETRRTTDEENYQGLYAPDRSLLPIQPQSGSVWVDRTTFTLSMLENTSEGTIAADTGYLTDNEFRTAGGFTDTNPLLNYNTSPRHIDIEAVMRNLAAGETSAYNIEIDLSSKTVNNPYSLNRGNIARNVETTRNTLLITDWVYDSTANRVLILLSNPEKHLRDLIVQYSLTHQTYRTLYTFPNSIKAHRITRRDTSNYYILTSDSIIQDRSQTELPRPIDKTAYAYDSISEGSVIRIHHFNASTATLTEHVPEDNDRPPQMGIHYHVGFENAVYADEFEGVRSEYRGAFKTVGDTLYYRYAKDDEFGVASVNTSGATTEVIDQTTLNYHNHLNFAFDVLSNGTVYFVYATGDDSESSLVIKNVISGTESTELTDTQDFEDLTHLDANGGAYLGCHEALFHDDTLYMLCPIQRVDEDSGTYTRAQDTAAGMVLFSCDVTAGTPTLTKITQWDFVTHSGCNLTIHDGNIHYVESPIASTVYKPINPNL